jgi:hypothetical protein
MGSDAIIYMLSFIKTGSGVQKLIGVGITDSLLSFFQNKESRLKRYLKF